MTRALTFDGERGAQRFALLRTALMNGGDGKGDRSPAIIRKEARLIDALDAVSDPAPDGHEIDRVLKATNGTGPWQVLLAQEDFELLQQYTEKTPWTPRAARQAVDLWDWLSATERRD